MNGSLFKQLLISYSFLFSCAFAHTLDAAVDVYIDNTLFTDCATYDVANRRCLTGDARAFTSFESAAAAAKPGMRFNIRAGVFNTALHMRVSGTEQAPIEWRAFNDEKVLISETSTRVMDDDFGPLWFDEVEWNVVSGLTLNETIGFVWSVGSHHNVIENNVFDTSKNYPSQSKRGGLYFIGSDYNRVRGNKILRGTDSLALVDSSYNIVEDNIFDTAGHDLWNIKCGSYNVIRNNQFSNPEQKLGSVFDCEEATMAWAGNGRFAVKGEKLDATKRNLIEGNVFDISTAYYSSSGGNGIQYSGQDGIIRRNVFTRNNIGLGMTHYDTEALYNYGNRIYHNVFYNNHCAGILTTGGDAAGKVADNVYVNNILWDNKGWGYEGGCDAASDSQILYRNGPFRGHAFRSNAIASPRGTQVVRDEFGEGSPVKEFASDLLSTHEVDPLFVDAAKGNFHLQSGSPLIDAAEGLTFTSARGEGLLVTVKDASFFYDGWGVAGEQGDLICIASASNCARIQGVDYDNNILVLAEPLRWSRNAPVNLAYTGDGPDIGAFEAR